MNEGLIIYKAQQDGLPVTWARPMSDLEYGWETSVGKVFPAHADDQLRGLLLHVVPYTLQEYRDMVYRGAAELLKRDLRMSSKQISVDMSRVTLAFNEKKTVDEAAQQAADGTLAGYGFFDESGETA